MPVPGFDVPGNYYDPDEEEPLRLERTMGMELLSVETAVDNHQQAAYQNEPSFLNHMRGNAARALAERILAEASIYRRIDPTEDELRENPFAPVRHRWRLGIERDMTALEARERQMDEARRAGVREAAASLREQAARYDRVDGPCKWVLQNSLTDAAAELDKLACA